MIDSEEMKEKGRECVDKKIRVKCTNIETGEKGVYNK